MRLRSHVISQHDNEVEFKFYTLNVCWLVTPLKPDLVLNELALLDLDIILLQETHV